ncbi:DUF397 domain-containing protein [Kitasatospora sp. NBC_01287]|uniref:DUF397 domain-containing protein n=1 Tax=Kitasatospora sp. NBC_01287 TaxID=2903573 RepID=UPI002252440C|nr:DUF397 domain-containing protein [Kitasatospora sp. NBC_01287]MCX4747830.1 DUF397 domain-containing protein [Kitasatospora sp. NBC_01287]
MIPSASLWRKSSYSNPEDACVEVVDRLPTVPVRDSKDPAGPALDFPAPAWSAFVAALRTGELPGC